MSDYGTYLLTAVVTAAFLGMEGADLRDFLNLVGAIAILYFQYLNNRKVAEVKLNNEADKKELHTELKTLAENVNGKMEMLLVTKKAEGASEARAQDAAIKEVVKEVAASAPSRPAPVEVVNPVVPVDVVDKPTKP